MMMSVWTTALKAARPHNRARTSEASERLEEVISVQRVSRRTEIRRVS